MSQWRVAAALRVLATGRVTCPSYWTWDWRQAEQALAEATRGGATDPLLGAGEAVKLRLLQRLIGDSELAETEGCACRGGGGQGMGTDGRAEQGIGADPSLSILSGE